MRYATVMVFVFGFVVIVSCDSDDGDETDGDADADTDVDSDVDADGDASDIECEFGSEFLEPFDRSCDDDGDCLLTFHAFDCCRTLMASGVNGSVQGRFEAAWTICDEELERCRCASGPTVVEDGSTTLEHDSIAVRCEEGTCRSYIP